MLRLGSLIFLGIFTLCLGKSFNRGQYHGQRPSRERPSMDSNALERRLHTMKYLKRYGYLRVDPSKAGGTRADFPTALRKFQHFMGLPQDDTYGDETMDVINHPRCGVVDPLDAEDQSFTLFGGKWNKTDLTYRIQGSVDGFSKRQIAAVVARAFDIFTPHVPLTFTPVPKREPADIQIVFQTREDDPDMDGEGKSVGWAYPPLEDSPDTGNIFLDAEEDYTIDGPEGTPLLAVVAHEIGHVLGLGHTSDHDSIMTPCVPDYEPDYQLSQVDIDALNQLYAPRSEGEPNTLEPTPAAERAFCQMSTYDAVTVMDGFLYVFKGERYWKLTTDGALLSPSEGALISDVWPEVESDVDVVYKNSLDHVVITKGGKYYEYDVTGILFPWAPRSTRLMNIPKNADTGYSIQGIGFFMRGGKLWSMDEVTRRVHPDSPMTLRRLWGYSPENVDSAFILNDYLYILNGQEYEKLATDTVRLEETGPHNFAVDFLGC